MPASSGVGIVSGAIESSLRGSLGGSSTSDLDQRLISASKRVLLHNIDFQKADNDSNYQLDSLRSKYKPLNSGRNDAGVESENHTSKITMKPKVDVPKINGILPQKNKGACSGYDLNDGIPKPAVVLFSPDKVQMEWKMSNKGIGMGLRNSNNNCYLNSVLQCLTYTPPLVNYLYSPDHTLSCKQAGFCMMCELQRHIKRCLDQPRIPNRDCTISPQSILGKIKMIAKHLSYGRQEDAHEFLRYVVEAMQKSNLNSVHEKLDRPSKDTTVVNQIFGCYLRSQVMCLRCKERSNTYDPALDISLDIKNVNTLHRAFERFVAPETLDNDNAYNCPRCKTKVAAQKRFTVHRAPNILTVQLKRFDYHRMHGGKINRQINYPERLNLRPYMSQNTGPAVVYQLYSVLIHVGHSVGSGHYYCNVRAPNGQWFNMNDSHVSSISVQRVLNCEAYLLFYARQKPSMNQTNLQKPIIGPTLPPGHKLGQHDKSSVIGRPSNDFGTPVSRHENNGKPSGILKTSTTPPSQPAVRPTQLLNSAPKPTSIPLPSQRDKVSFGITKPKSAPQSAPQSDGEKPPRIVMQIKHGKVFFPTNEEKNSKDQVNGVDGSAKVMPKIVPYNDDSSNSDEEETLVIKPPVPGQPVKRFEKTSPHNGNVRGPIFDKRLNATTVVPGAYKPLDTGLDDANSLQKPRDLSPCKAAQAKFTSPLRRSVSDSLSVVTNSGPQQKVNINSTTSWFVLDQEAAISPSLASGSSNTSVNSTTDWHITPGVENRTKPVLPEAQCNGWVVTPVKENGVGKSHTSKKEENHKHSSGEEADESTSRNELNITIKKQPHNGGWESKLKTNPSSERDKNEGFDNHSSSKTSVSSLSTLSDGASLSNSTTSLLNGHEEGNDSSGSSSHHKKHKKHKKHKREYDDEERTVNGCGVTDFLNKIKKKKKKKHKHEDREALISTSDSDSSHQGRKRSSSSDETSDSKKPRQEENTASKTDYVWVERTKDNSEKERPFKKEVKAQVQSWDHHIKDGFKSRSDEEPSRQKMTWDGSRSKSETVFGDLKKMSSLGYGSHVHSWDGGKSNIDQEVEKDRHYERKRTWSDDYEDELDRGKAKKYKSYNDKSSGHHYGAGNPFQRTQDMRSSDRDKPRSQGWYDRSDRHSSYHSSHNHRDGGYRDGYRDSGRWGDNSHRGGSHRDNNYHGHSSHYNSYNNRDNGYRNKNGKHYRYH